MCGITGVVRFDGKPVNRGRLENMVDQLCHRGRDGRRAVIGRDQIEGSEIQFPASDSVGLGHTRLSVIDLTPEARQPMSNSDGNIWVTFNGEIYNYIELRDRLKNRGYRFRTQSDTEVLIAAYEEWGKRCVDRFDGMFAFGLWDQKRSRLVCARDAMGVKPFYYVLGSDCIAFASESSVLTPFVSGKINPNALGAYLMSMYVPGSWSIYEGVQKLPAGTVLEIDLTGRCSTYSNWELPPSPCSLEEENPSKRLEKLLKSAVERQLRSDVPIGVLLSGGVDSSILVAMARPYADSLYTFSAGYEGLGVNELPYARSVAEQYDTEHNELRITAANIVPKLERALGSCTEPIADTAGLATFLLSERAAGEGVKVLLSGTGGDEVFGGYTRYQLRTPRRRLLEAIRDWLPSSVKRLLKSVRPDWGSRLLDMSFDTMVSTSGRPRFPARVLGPDFDLDAFYQDLIRNCFPGIRARGSSRIEMRRDFDLQVYLVDQLLLMLDQMTMAHTIEGRVPLLNRHVVAEATDLPVGFHVDRDRTKKLLRDIAANYLDRDFVERDKQGFGGPAPFWVMKNLDPMKERLAVLRDLPLDTPLRVAPYLNLDVEDLDQQRGEEIFRLYCLSVWFDESRHA